MGRNNPVVTATILRTADHFHIDISKGISRVASTNDLKNGMVLNLDGQLWSVVWFQHHKPGKGGAVMRTKLKNVLSGKVVDKTFNADVKVEVANVDKRDMTYLYNDGGSYVFMDSSTYEQVHISAEALGDSKDFLVAEMLIRVEFYDVEPVGIELPPTVDLVVKETVPGIKGATASNQIKPATLETGLVIQVPPFVNEGDKVRVNTETGEYQSRV